MPAESQVFWTAVGGAKEAVWGTPLTPTFWCPCENPRFGPQALRHILDTGRRGLRSTDFDILAGPGEGAFSFGGLVYADSFPHFMMGMLGSDTPGAGPDPFAHVMKLSPTPPSYTFEWQNNTQTYQISGARPSAVTINFNARDGALSYSVQGMGKLGTPVASTATAFTTQQGIAGWQGTVSVAGSAPATLMEGSITIQHGLKPIHGLNGTQDISSLYAQDLQVTMRLTFDFTGPTEYAYFTAPGATKNEIKIKFANAGTPERSCEWLLTKAAWRLVDLEPNDNIYTAVAQINGIHNVTDGGSLKFTAMNGRALTY